MEVAFPGVENSSKSDFVEPNGSGLIRLSDAIICFGELGMQERRSANRMTWLLEQTGFCWRAAMLRRPHPEKPLELGAIGHEALRYTGKRDLPFRQYIDVV
jgi:hypothetical protein